MFKKNKTRFIVYVALLTAMSVVLKMFASFPLTVGGFYVNDLNPSPIIIMFSGAAFGPLAGGIVGGLTDLIVSLIRPRGAYIPLFTLTNVLIGVIPALFFMKKPLEKISFLKCCLSVLIVQVVCSIFLNTLWNVLLGFIPFDMALIFTTRVLPNIAKWIIFAIALYFLLRALRKTINKLISN